MTKRKMVIDSDDALDKIFTDEDDKDDGIDG
jgi:hypothetical protein